MSATSGVVRGGQLILACVGLVSLWACGGGDPEPIVNAKPETEEISAHALANSIRTVIFKGSDKVAIADLVEQSVEDPCIYSYIQIVANKSKALTDGVASKYKGLAIYGYSFNSCTGLADGYIAGGTDDASVAINETRASAHGRFPVEFAGGVFRTVEIHLNWNGGEITCTICGYGTTKTVTIGPNLKLVSKTNKWFKYADSVTGSFVIDGEDRLAIGHNSGISGYTALDGQTSIEIIKTP